MPTPIQVILMRFQRNKKSGLGHNLEILSHWPLSRLIINNKCCLLINNVVLFGQEVILEFLLLYFNFIIIYKISLPCPFSPVYVLLVFHTDLSPLAFQNSRFANDSSPPLFQFCYAFSRSRFRMCTAVTFAQALFYLATPSPRRPQAPPPP